MPLSACLCDHGDLSSHTTNICDVNSFVFATPLSSLVEGVNHIVTLRPAVDDGGRGGGESSLNHTACMHMRP